MGFGTDPLYKEDEDERDWGKNDPRTSSLSQI